MKRTTLQGQGPEIRRFILDAVRTEGVDYVFLVPGGAIDQFYDVFESAELKAVVTASETGAAFMADGYGRLRRKFGVCMGISGPGVANFVPAIAAASADRASILAIAGEIDTRLSGLGTFQDATRAGLNDLEILQTITRCSLQIEAEESVHLFIRTAMRSMLGIRRGPVYLKVPAQLQCRRLRPDERYQRLPTSVYVPRTVEKAAADEALCSIAEHEKVAILAGDGILASDSGEELLRFANSFQIPVATTLKAKGAIAEKHPLALGVFGYAGSKRAIETLTSGGIEALVVLGSSLSQRDTLYWSPALQPATLIHVDLDQTVIGRSYLARHEVVGDVRTVLRHWLYQSEGETINRLRDKSNVRFEWVKGLREIPLCYDEDVSEGTEVPGSLLFHPARIVRAMRKVATQVLGKKEPTVLVDSGAHRVFGSHYWLCWEAGRFLSATALAPMGWAVSASIGAALADAEKRPAIVFTGDGCMLMQGMELSTAAKLAQRGTPPHVIWIVFNNQALGNVHLRTSKMSKAAQALTTLKPQNWADFAQSLGCKATRIDCMDRLETAFEQALSEPGPWLIDVPTLIVPTPVDEYANAKDRFLPEQAYIESTRNIEIG